MADEASTPQQGRVYDPPDFTLLNLLRPLEGRRLVISPVQYFSVADASDQVLAASTVVATVFNPNNLVLGTLTALVPNQVWVVENLNASILCTDASGKIQVLIATLNVHGSQIILPAQFQGTLPFTFPALTNVQVYTVAVMPVVLFYPPGFFITPGLGLPRATILLNNTDASPHNYKRGMSMTYRTVDNVDMLLRGVIQSGRH